MRKESTILKKFNVWKDNPLLVSGAYRLLAYVKWDSIPKEYQAFFDEKAKEEWDKEPITTNEELKKAVENDINVALTSILKVFSTGSFVQPLGLIPMLIADVFILGQPVDSLIFEILKIINYFTEGVHTDRRYTESETLLKVGKLLQKILNKVNITLNYDLDRVIDDIINGLRVRYDTEFISKAKYKLPVEDFNSV